MNAKRSTLLAFLLNACFAIIELIFGVLFNSSAVLADAVHDAGDAVAIGLSAFLETFSNRKEDQHYTLGYKRFSLLGAMITAVILITGSIFVLTENIPRLLQPEPVNHQGMLVLGIVAILINLLASLVVRGGHTRNESILSLHFLEDILGWLAVIIVAIILNFTDWYFLDPVLSLGISLFILSKALPKFWSNLKIFLAAVPEEINLAQLEEEIKSVDNVLSLNQLNIWSMDGLENNAILHICIQDWERFDETKHAIRHLLEHHSIQNVTIEVDVDDHCHQGHKRDLEKIGQLGHHHGHHHHH